MEDWNRWSHAAGDAVIDLGSPLGAAVNIGTVSASVADHGTTGYSILQAETSDAVMKLLEDHTHLKTHDDSLITAIELLHMAGMWSSTPRSSAVASGLERWIHWHGCNGDESSPIHRDLGQHHITGLSVAVALFIGNIELFGLIATELGFSGGSGPTHQNFDINQAGFIIVGLFVGTWVAALSVWRFGHIEQRWEAAAARRRSAYEDDCSSPGSSRSMTRSGRRTPPATSSSPRRRVRLACLRDAGQQRAASAVCARV
jgi:hypothetical protein